ncbi:uncharacterized protein [Dermacentor andersoni]|uniref:uncharacterized protein n=1 Tax=Dermacentor andersoni TaxID=34620 RepID=UPI0024178FF5|nr:uncharacterized protein LOC129382538 [Dermacentor andersoni]
MYSSPNIPFAVKRGRRCARDATPRGASPHASSLAGPKVRGATISFHFTDASAASANMLSEPPAPKEGRRVRFGPNWPDGDDGRAKRGRSHRRRRRISERLRRLKNQLLQLQFSATLQSIKDRLRQTLVVQALLFIFAFDGEGALIALTQATHSNGLRSADSVYRSTIKVPINNACAMYGMLKS